MLHSRLDWISGNAVVSGDQLNYSSKCPIHRSSHLLCEWIADPSFSAMVSLTAVDLSTLVSLVNVNNCLLLPIATDFPIFLAFPAHHCSQSLGGLFLSLL
ncbi:unnamed protein product [Heterobilharzia americana]|nr:unnamed protein product [Heterobilharzia americana]